MSRSRALAVIAAAMSLLATGCGSRVPAGAAARTAAPPRTALSPAATLAPPWHAGPVIGGIPGIGPEPGQVTRPPVRGIFGVFAR